MSYTTFQWFNDWGGCRGGWGRESKDFPNERLLFQAADTVATRPQCARRLVAHPFIRSGLIEWKGGVCGVAFVHFDVTNNPPKLQYPTKSRTQYWPTGRYCVCHFRMHWGIGGCGGFVPVVLFVYFGWEACWQYRGPRSDNAKTTQTAPALRPALYAPFFASPRCWGPGGCMGGCQIVFWVCYYWPTMDI